MILVVEGADGAGKTTLVKEVERIVENHYDLLRSLVLHNGPPRPDQDLFRHYVNQTVTAMDPERFVIVDRMHLGELVYPKTRNRAPHYGTDEMMVIQKIVNRYGLTVVLDVVPDIACSRVESKGETVDRDLLSREILMWRAVGRLRTVRTIGPVYESNLRVTAWNLVNWVREKNR